MKIVVYGICKNEEAFVERFCQSAADADLILLADTGSTDNTISIARQNGATVHEITVNPWRFDVARNMAMDLIPIDYDVCVSMDLDEVLEPGWREEIESIWTTDTTNLRYRYNIGYGTIFHLDVIHSRFGYRWHHPAHEHLLAEPNFKQVIKQTDKLLVSQKDRDELRDRSFYVELSRLSVKEDSNCVISAFLHLYELVRNSFYEEAIEAAERYLTMPKATDAYQRCTAYRLLAACYSALGNEEKEIESYLLATGIAPTIREPWVDLANAYLAKKQWKNCYNAITKALAINHYSEHYTNNMTVWSYIPYHCAGIAASNLGKLDEARKYLQIAADMEPNNLQLQQDLNAVL